MKRILNVFLILSLLCVVFYHAEKAGAYTGNASGSCGDSLFWSFQAETGTLRIRGTGEMTQYAFGEAPWTDCLNSINRLILQEGITSIGSYAFCFLEQVTGELILPESLQTIECYAFQGSVGFTGDLRIPDNVERIESNAFDGCEGLNGTLTLGERLSYIGECAFYGCTGLGGSLVLPDSVCSIGESAFAGCGFTGTVSIGTGLLSEKDPLYAITGKTFENCSGIQAFSVAENNPNLCAVNGILYTKDKRTLLCCPAGKKDAIAIEASVKTISSHAFLSCGLLTGNLALPEDLTEIGENAFRNCRGFSGVLTIPDSVERIGDGAFRNCSGFSDKIVLGRAVERIGAKAFADCTGIKRVYFRGNAPYIDTGYQTASFPKTVCLYFQNTASGWNYPEWWGYETALWNPDENDNPIEPAEYLHKIRLVDEAGEELLLFTEQTTDECGKRTDRIYHVTEDFIMEELKAGQLLPQSFQEYFPGYTHYVVSVQSPENLSGTFADTDITTTIVLKRRACRTETVYQWNQDSKTGKWTCTARYHCIYDACTETVPQTETASEENGGIRMEVTATCTESGSRNVVASFQNTLFETKKKTLEAVSAWGHRWEKNADGSNCYTIDREPTETQKGQMSVHCTVCHASNTETVINYTVSSVSILAPAGCSVTLDNPNLTIRFSGVIRDELRYLLNGTERTLTKEQIQSGQTLTVVQNGVSYRLDCSGVWFEKENDDTDECEGMRLAERSAGRHTLYLDGKEAGTFVFAQSGENWTIYDESRKQYLSFDQTTNLFRYDTAPFSWKLEDGFYTETESDALTPFAARLGTIRHYLTQDENGLTVGVLSAKAEIYEWGKGEHIWRYCSVNEQEHEVFCTVCGTVHRQEEHRCDTETGLCVCGYRGTEAEKVRITVKKLPNDDIQHWRMTYYEITVENTSVSRVEYSTNGGESWEEGTAFALLEEVERVTVRVTDAEGVYYVVSSPVI